MPLKITADHREILIDIFFAIIIAIGFEYFIHHFFLEGVVPQLRSFDLTSLIKVFSSHEISFDTLFFFATYFWVISHWVFYHELIERYPYYNWWKFFVDVTIFSLMFVIINISFSAYNVSTTPLFILLVDIWYLFACFWHLSDRKLRPIGRYVNRHVKRLATYSSLLVLLYDPLSLGQIVTWYRDIIMLGMIIALITWNIHRLRRFVKRNLREYGCSYVRGYPGWQSKVDKGTLELVRYPIESDEENTIRFSTASPAEDFKIEASRVSATRVSNDRSAIKRTLELDYTDRNGKRNTLVLELRTPVIAGVKTAIEEMLEKENG